MLEISYRDDDNPWPMKRVQGREHLRRVARTGQAWATSNKGRRGSSRTKRGLNQGRPGNGEIFKWKVSAFPTGAVTFFAKARAISASFRKVSKSTFLIVNNEPRNEASAQCFGMFLKKNKILKHVKPSKGSYTHDGGHTRTKIRLILLQPLGMPGPTPLGAANRNSSKPASTSCCTVWIFRAAFVKQFCENRGAGDAFLVFFIRVSGGKKKIDKCNPPRRYCF